MRQEISIWLLVFSSLLGQPIWKEGDESNIQKALPLPFFNEGFNRVVMISGEERAYLAAIGNGFVTWMDNGSIQLSVNYYCSKTRDCMAHFRLNNSKNMLNIKCYGTRRLIPTQQPTRYMATVLLTPLQKAGFAIVAFDLLVVHNLKLEGKATGQYVVHMQPPNKRYLIHNCNFKVKAYPRVNMLVFHVDPRPFMPNGLQWQKFIIHKRISLETPPAKNYVNVPIIIMTRSPFIFIKINFYYFKDVTFELSENGKIQLKGTTGSGVNYHDSGMYTLRWYTYDSQHFLDEQCEELSNVPMWSQPPPLAPITAFSEAPTAPERWEFDFKPLQTKLRKQNTVKNLVACIWQDAYQKIPQKRPFYLVITRRAFFSEGEQLGFLMYAYKGAFTKSDLPGFYCLTESMQLAGMKPFTYCLRGADSFTPHPDVSTSPTRLKFVIRREFACSKNTTPIRTSNIRVLNPNSSRNFEVITQEHSGVDSCNDSHQTTVVPFKREHGWKQGEKIIFENYYNGKKEKTLFVLMDEDNVVTVNPLVAIDTQEVEVSCFKNRASILKKHGIDKITSIEMLGEIGPNNYISIARYQPDKGYQLVTENIDSNVKLGKGDAEEPSLKLRAKAFQLNKFQGFRCEMTINDQRVREYRVESVKPVCFLKHQSPIVMTVNNNTIPITAIDKENLGVYQASCIHTHDRIAFQCNQWLTMEQCSTLPSVDSVYHTHTDLIIYIPKSSSYEVRTMIFDRFGNGRIDVPSVPFDWHDAQVVCHRTVYLLEEAFPILTDQYSPAVRLCLTKMSFKFFLAHARFLVTQGLNASFTDLPRKKALKELDPSKLHAAYSDSAVICLFEGNIVNKTVEIVYENSYHSQLDDLKLLNQENNSILILSSEANKSAAVFLSIWCQIREKNSLIVAKSATLRIMVIRTDPRKNGAEEIYELFVGVFGATVIGAVIAASCPIVASLNELRRNHQKAKCQKTATENIRLFNFLRQTDLEKGNQSEHQLAHLRRTKYRTQDDD